MDNFNAQCLCLRSVDYRESDKLVTLYAEGLGKLSATLKSCKSGKSKLKFAAMPLNFATYEFAEKGGRLTVTGCEQTESFFDITADPAKYSAACVALEFVEKVSMEGDFTPQLYIVTLKFLRALAYENYPVKTLLTRYLNVALESVGYLSLETLSQIGRFIENELDIKIHSLEIFSQMVD